MTRRRLLWWLASGGIQLVSARHQDSQAGPRYPARRLLPSMVAARGTAETEGYLGYWSNEKQAGEKRADDKRVTEIVFVPLDLSGNMRGDSSTALLGAIPSGPFEGAGRFVGSPREAIGTWRLAGSSLREVTASMRRSSEGVLDLVIGGTHVRLTRGPDVDLATLSRLSIIGHRAASLGKPALMNTLDAIAQAPDFGCAGIEIDVMVPFAEVNGRKQPLPSELRVHHPPELRSELTGFDSQSLRATENCPRLADALAAARRAGVRYVYLDFKFRWLRRQPAALREAVAYAVDIASREPHVHLLWSAECSGPGETADVLAALAACNPGVDWILEFTRGTKADRVRQYLERPIRERPSCISWNLLRLDESRQGPLGWLLSELASEDEAQYAGMLDLPMIFWTVSNDHHVRGLRSVLDRFGLRRRPSGNTAVMASRPHRVLFHAGRFR